MNTTLTVQINGEDRCVPDGVELLGEVDLYSVSFSLLQVPEVDDGENIQSYKWFNPRRLGRTNQADGVGFGKVDMVSLYEDIKDEGLLSPLICRWDTSKVDGSLLIQVLDGERRWRCLSDLIAKNEKSWCRGAKKWRTASEVYKSVPCRIVTGNDKEALKIAFMVSDRSVNWGEAAVANLIRRLRECNCSDTEILELTKKSPQWLREQDRICDLDDMTFAYLTDGKINRALALILTDVEDIDRRQRHLRAAYDDALARHEELVQKTEDSLVKAVEKEEIAEAEMGEAEILGGDTDKAAEKLESAQKRTTQKRQARSAAAKPQAKTANYRRGTQALGDAPKDDIAQDNVVQKHLEAIQAVIADGGKIKDDKGNWQDVMDVATLNAVEVCYKAIINGDKDVIRLLRRHRAANILTSRRNAMKAQEREALIEEEVADEV